MASKSSRRWLNEHFSDPYVKQAQQEGFRSRATYKLLELQEKEHLFKPGMTVVDLGASPGGWSQLTAKFVKPNGKVFAIDLLPMDPIEGVDFIQGDFTDDNILSVLQNTLLANNHSVDWVLSDMAPNLSGHDSIDIPRVLYLAELALHFALTVLQSNGGCVIKIFQGEGFDHFLSECKRHFYKTVIKKPKASRGRSRELYVITRKLRAS